MYITKDNISIYLSWIKRDPRWLRKAHIIQKKNDRFCMCMKLTKGKEYLVSTSSNIFKVMLELDVVCNCCVRNYNEYVLGDSGDGS